MESHIRRVERWKFKPSRMSGMSAGGAEWTGGNGGNTELVEFSLDAWEP